MAITLAKSFENSSTYVADLDSNFTILEDEVNAILGSISGSSGSLSVPAGLAEIFDRDGVIGIASYQLTNQTVTADVFSLPAGAAWVAQTFRKRLTSTSLNTSTLTNGTRYINVNSAGDPSLSETLTAESIYSFTWTDPVISAATLIVDILLDGDDYNDMLTSTSKATNYTSVAARLEAIEDSLGILGDMYAEDATAHSGLNFGYKSGKVRNDNVVSDTAASTILLADNDVNYVEVTPSTGVITTNITGFTSSRIPLFEVTTASGVITTPAPDKRTWASLGGGGGGGGHAQNTDTGTDNSSFTLNATQAGAPTANGSLVNERGTSPNVEVRWNETTDKWEFTNDGTTYQALSGVDLGVQELCKFVALEDPPVVASGTGVGSTSGYTQVDLTSTSPFSTIPDGVQGMLLRIQFDDSAPTASTVILIRKIEDAGASPTESMRVFARDSADVDDLEGSMITTQGEGFTVGDVRKIGFEYDLTASGGSSANFKIFVMGYWERVTGAGTQDVTFTHTTSSIAATDTITVNLANFANRMLIHSINFTKNTGSATGLSDFTAYRKDTHLAADLEYQLDNIDPASGATDTLPWMHIDDDDTAELHYKLKNNDATNAITWDITIRGERFD
jgi:hypothetical protein